MKKITMKDIAQQAGVSIATVSKILNNVDMHISEATRQRVLRIVEEQHYVPNEIAKGLRRKNSNMVGVIVHDITDPFTIDLIAGIESRCKNRGTGVLICNAGGDKESEIEDLKYLNAKMVDGIIILRTLSRSDQSLLSHFKIPTIIVDREVCIEAEDVGWVTSSSLEAVYMATELLINRGCRNISYIGPSETTLSSSRIQGYVHALADKNIPYRNNLVYCCDDFVSETGVKGVNKLLETERFDGLVCANDLIAAGAMMALNARGLRIPQDVKVVGIDNIQISKYLNPPLTTVDLHAFRVGQECAKMLLARIWEGKPLKKKLIACDMVLRKSV